MITGNKFQTHAISGPFYVGETYENNGCWGTFPAGSTHEVDFWELEIDIEFKTNSGDYDRFFGINPYDGGTSDPSGDYGGIRMQRADDLTIRMECGSTNGFVRTTRTVGTIANNARTKITAKRFGSGDQPVDVFFDDVEQTYSTHTSFTAMRWGSEVTQLNNLRGYLTNDKADAIWYNVNFWELDVSGNRISHFIELAPVLNASGLTWVNTAAQSIGNLTWTLDTTPAEDQWKLLV